MKEKIVIGLGTKSRPEMLRRALESLIELIVPAEVEALLIVCENGIQPNNREIVNEVSDKLAFKSLFLEEERIGIAFMRNRILNEAIDQNASLIAFFDDDEEVDTSWLKHLYKAKHEYHADVVQGAVLQNFEKEPSSHLIKKFYPGSFSKMTGEDLKDAYTNNVLFDLSVVEKHNLRFNERFNLVGGSDSLFFKSLREKGARIVFCKEAIVNETIPPQRSTIEWLLARFYRNGYASFLMDLERYGTVKAYWKGIGFLYRSLRRCLFGRSNKTPENEQEMIIKKRCLRAKGMLDAMLGVSFEEYKVIHGS